MSEYIQPKIKKFDSFEKLIKEKEAYGIFEFRFGGSRPFSEIMNFKKTFILAEPGNGKTRCLKEIAKEASGSGKSCLFLDIKKIDTFDIEKFIKQKINYADKLNSNLSIEISNFFATDKFSLKNSDNVVICLDALDEVNQNIFSKVVENIKEFSKKYEKISLYVSCRIHFFQKYFDLFELDKFSYIHLSPLFQFQIETLLLANGVKKEHIKKILHTLDFKRDLIIQTPRYLEFLVEFIKEKDIKELSNLKISNLFEFFIYRKLEVENRKNNQYTCIQLNTIKRVLEKLALLMEIRQVSRISEDDLMTFFDDIDSSLTLSFLQASLSELFFERGIIKDGFNKELGNFFEFENTEFQEYLAAKEILRLGNVNRVLYALSIDPILKEVYPSWFNTLRFVINLDSSILSYILNLKNIGNSRIPIAEYHQFITKIDMNSLDDNTRKAIFIEVFYYYKERAKFLDVDLLHNLAYFFDKTHTKLLKDIIESNLKSDNLKINKVNVIRLVSYIVDRNLFNSREILYWKKHFTDIALANKNNEDLRRVALAGLRSFNDKGILDDIKIVLKENTKSLTKEIIYLYEELDPRSDETMRVLAEGTKRGCYIESLGFLLRGDTDKDSVNSFFDYLIVDNEFLSSFLKHESIFKDDVEVFIGKVSEIFDANFYTKVLSIIEKAFSGDRFWNAENSPFINKLAKVSSSYNNNFLLDLVTKVETTSELQKNIFGLQNVFKNSLTISNIKEFIDRLKKIEHGERVALWALLGAQGTDEDIFLEGEKYFKKEYEENRKYAKKHKKQQAYYQLQEKKRLDEEIAISLTEIKDKKTQLYHFNALVELLRQGEDKQIKTSDKQKKELKTICKFVFHKFDPQIASVKISRKDKSIRIHPWIMPFGIALDASRKLDAIDIIDNKIRQRLINFIPYAYENQLEAIFYLIGDIKKKELEALLKQYGNDKKNDKWRYRPRSIVELIKKFELEEYRDLLESFIEDEALDLYDRKYALIEIENLYPNKKYLINIFNRYKNKKDSQKEIAEKANELLITKYILEAAINWRINELVKRAFAFVRLEGVHSVSSSEHELDSKEFAAPIFDIAMTKPLLFINEIIDLTNKSLEIYKKGPEFHAYASYLWEIAITYLERQKIHRTYSVLDKFEKFIMDNLSRDGVNFISSRFQSIKTEYANYIGKPVSFSECIKQYNNLKKVKFEKISNSLELKDTIVEIIQKDIRPWIEDEGALKVMETLTKRNEGEDLIQKNLLTQFRYCASKRGFIENEILFTRESEFLDGSKTDYLISYGFIGPLLIEIKRTDNGDVVSKKYRKDKLLKYMKGSKSEYCIFLVLKIKKKESLNAKIEKAREIYKQDFPHVVVLGIDCVGTEGLIV